MTRRADPAGDFDYEQPGIDYARQRRADPRIAALIHAALGDASTVLNVGAGTGSYEPNDRSVLAVEPSAQMRSQRASGLLPAVDAAAEKLPFDDDAFDASMATITVHQWSDAAAGLREMRRVTRGPVVILTMDAVALRGFWLGDFVPELLAAERRRFPSIDAVANALGGTTTITPVPVAADCTDGFGEAFYARPEGFLDPRVRASQSGWGFITADETDRGVAALSAALTSGEWDRQHGHLRAQPTYASSLRLLRNVPAS